MLDLFSMGIKDGRTYHIVDKKSGKCLDVCGNGKSNDTAIILFTLKKSDNQKFIAKDCGNSEWELRPCSCSNFAVDIAAGSAESGAIVQIYSINNTSAQRFKLEKKMVGYKILSKCSGFSKGLGTKDGKDANLTQIVQCESSGANEWVFEEA